MEGQAVGLGSKVREVVWLQLLTCLFSPGESIWARAAGGQCRLPCPLHHRHQGCRHRWLGPDSGGSL